MGGAFPGEIPFHAIEDMMYPALKKELQIIRPSIVVSDFAAFAGTRVAKELRLPCCVNLPGPMLLPAISRGLKLLHPMALARIFNFGRVGEFLQKIKNETEWCPVFVHSFLELEPEMRSITFPAHVKIVGPVLPPIGNLLNVLEKEHPSLSAWMNQSPDQTTILISTGSHVVLKDFQVRALYEGCLQAGVRVVWGLKDEVQKHLPHGAMQHPDFWISHWLPQAEVMNHSAIKAVVTHCGWGGSLECIVSGKPILALPFFGDQPDNANIFVEAGAGTFLCDPIKMNFTPTNKYEPGSLTSQMVAERVREITTNQSFSKKIKHFQSAVKTTGGAPEVAAYVERMACYGLSGLGTASRVK